MILVYSSIASLVVKEGLRHLSEYFKFLAVLRDDNTVTTVIFCFEALTFEWQFIGMRQYLVQRSDIKIIKFVVPSDVVENYIKQRSSAELLPRITFFSTIDEALK